MKVRNEELFARLAADPKNPTVQKGCDCACCKIERATPDDEGRQQFFDMQSKGIMPDSPADYYLRLMKGKQEFDRLTSEYRYMYLNGEWWGFECLWRDWEGERWILPHLCLWYPEVSGWPLPSWLGVECTDMERLEYHKRDLEFIIDNALNHKVVPASRQLLVG